MLVALSGMRGFVLRFLGWARVYVRGNWGAPFVLGFMGLLMIAAALLIVGLPWPAELVGDFAYFSLVFGVILQLVCFWRASKVRNNGSGKMGGDGSVDGGGSEGEAD
jgi:hypothetical protein